MPNQVEYKFIVTGKQYTYSENRSYFFIQDRFRIFMAACPTQENPDHWWENEWRLGNTMIRIAKGKNDSGRPRVFLTYEQFEPINGMVFQWYSRPIHRTEFIANDFEAYTIEYVPEDNSIAYHPIRQSESWAINPELIPKEFSLRSDFFSWLHK